MACKTRKPKKMEDGGLFGSMASGALSGSTLGPVGLIGGAALGAITYKVNEKRQQEAEQDILEAQQEAAGKYARQQSVMSQAQQAGIPTSVNNIPLMANGGNVYNPGMIGMMKSRMATAAAFNNPSALRMVSPNPKTGMTPEGIGTHYMASYDNYAIPLLQDEGGKSLKYYDESNPQYKEAIKFDSNKDAEYFAKHYKEIAPMMYGTKEFANGGMSGETVELEQGEPYMLPNGQIDNLSMNAPTHAQGGVTMNMPGGTKVLGKMDSEYGKQYKELGRKLSKAQSKYDKVLKENPTGIATKTAKRMLGNIENEFNNLFVSQEQQKMNPAYTPTMANGGTTPNFTGPQGLQESREYFSVPEHLSRGYQNQEYTFTPEQLKLAKEGDIIQQRPLYQQGTQNVIGYEQTRKGQGKSYVSINSPEQTFGESMQTTPEFAYGGSIHIKPENRGKFTATKKRTGKTTEELTHSKNPLTRKRAIFAQNARKWKHEDGGMIEEYAGGGLTRSKDYGSEKKPYPSVKSSDFAGGGRSYPIPTKADAVDALRLAGLHGRDDVRAKVYKKYPELRKGQNGLLTGYATPISGQIASNITPEGLTQGFTPSGLQSAYMTPQNANTSGLASTLSTLAGGAGNLVNTAATLAPVAYNLYQGSQGGTQLNAEDYYNPNTGQIESIMANRRYNIEPQLEANRTAEATYYRNLRGAAPSRAQYLSGLTAGQITRQRADAQAYAQQQNVNNQYQAEQAQMLQSLGQQQAQTDYGIDQFNLQSQAAAQGMTAAGLGQLSQYAQTNKLMGGQQAADQQRMNLLNDFANNYEFKNGKWVFKQTGQEADASQVQNIMNILNQ